VLYAKATKGRGLTEFKHSLHSLFHSFNALMKVDGDTMEHVVPIQVRIGSEIILLATAVYN
jgi:hypothetical protein